MCGFLKIFVLVHKFFLARESRERNSHPTLSLFEEQKLLFTKLLLHSRAARTQV